MSECVKEGDNLVVLKERWPLRGELAEISHKSSDWEATRAVGGNETRLEVEIGSVAVLATAWEKVEVQVANKSASLALFVPDSEHLHIGVPNHVLCLAALGEGFTIVSLDLDKNKTEKLRKGLQHTLNG